MSSLDKTTEKLMEKLRDLSGRVRALEKAKLELQEERDRLKESMKSGFGVSPPGKEKSADIENRPCDSFEITERFAFRLCERFDRILNHMSDVLRNTVTEVKSSGGKASENLSDLQRALNNVVSLNYKLFEIGGRQNLNPEKISVNSLLKDMESKILSTVPSRIHYSSYLTPGIAKISADTRQLEKAILYLTSFACHSMPHGGRLNVESSETGENEGPVDVVVTIRDNGLGFDRDSLLHIFEPYYIEKLGFDMEGTELSCAYGIVRQMGGKLLISSEPSRGTAFEIRFSAVSEKVTSTEGKDATTAIPGGSESRKTILCIDDEEIVREVVKEILEKAGFRVKTANGSAEAFSVFESLDYRPDLAVIDVIMPGMDGIELSREMKKMNPGLKILFMSGYVSDIKRAESDGIINKPFKSQGLLDKVLEILESG